MIGCVALGAAVAAPVSPVLALPQQPASSYVAQQNVDWLSADSASSLDLGFPVLVPGWIPEPFSGEPSVSASDGYYSLYWMNGGGDPTFLQITGQVGGSLPAGSPYDLNVELFVNASVQGYDAIHDVTPIYDQVWWIADGVLYTVNSRNMTGSDSLSLANSLSALSVPSTEQETAPEPTAVAEEPTAVPTDVPAAPETESSDTATTTDTPTEVPATDPEPTAVPSSAPAVAQDPVSGIGVTASSGSVTSGDTVSVSVTDAVNVNLSVDGGVFTLNDDVAIYNLNSETFAWVAPTVDSPTTFTFTVSSPATGETFTTTSVTVNPAAAGGDSSQDDSASTGSEQGTTVLSDGTDGPVRPNVVGDGTSGSQSVEIPRDDTNFVP